MEVSMMLKDPSIHDLLWQLKQGHEEVLDMLYPRYGRVFYTYARRHHLAHEDAEDVVQTTFWRLLDRIESYDETQESGEKWLWSICRNQVIDHLRRQKTRALPDDELLIKEFDPDPQLVEQERLRALASGWAHFAEREPDELRRGP